MLDFSPGLRTVIDSCAPIPHPAYEEQDSVFAEAFDCLRRGIEQRAFPGASLAITHQGKLVARKGLGRFTYEANSSPVSWETIFDLASVSKVVATAAAAMILYERGELDLEMPVVGVVPEFSGADPGRQEVTIRLLLAHSSGLPAYQPLFEKAQDHKELLQAACSLPLAADPGTRAEYSDIGFIILGEALSRLADEPLDDFCRREIFGPLGMSRTCFCPPAAWKHAIPPTVNDQRFRKRIIQGEVQDENASVLGGVAGHAGVFAPASDAAIFAHTMLQGGRPILRPETVARFTCRQDTPAGTSRALGWDTPSSPSQSGKYFSPGSYGHLGYTGTSLWIDPERQLSITLLTNRTWPDCRSQAIKTVRPAFHDAVVAALHL